MPTKVGGARSEGGAEGARIPASAPAATFRRLAVQFRNDFLGAMRLVEDARLSRDAERARVAALAREREHFRGDLATIEAERDALELVLRAVLRRAAS